MVQQTTVLDSCISLKHTQTDMDILKLLSCKGNKSSVVRQEVVIDFKETRWDSSMTVLMIWLVSDFCTLMLVGAVAKRW